MEETKELEQKLQDLVQSAPVTGIRISPDLATQEHFDPLFVAFDLLKLKEKEVGVKGAATYLIEEMMTTQYAAELFVFVIDVYTQNSLESNDFKELIDCYARQYRKLHE
jgi:hypothetical protein